MKSKYYLRGFGTGVLFATILLMIAFMLHENMASNHKNKVNSSGNASVLNKSTKDISSQSDTTAQDTTSPQESTALEESVTSQESIASEETTTSQDTTTQDNTTQEESTTTIETTTGSDNNGEYYTLTITSGMTSNKVADVLQQNGVVDSGYNLNMFLYNNGYESKIRVGTYQIKKGATYQEIASTITKK